MDPKHFEALYPLGARREELSQLVEYIRSGNSSQLIGLPGSGRSSLLGLLAYNKEIRLMHFPKNHDIVHFVMVNFSELRNRSLADVIKLLFFNLTDSLRMRKETADEYEIVDRFFKDALSYQDELVLTKGLLRAVEYLSLEKKLTIVFLFDRFDEYVPFVTTEFFTMLRSLRDRVKYRFSVIFSLSRPLEDSLESELFSDFSDFITGHKVFVRLYDKESLLFRISYLEKVTGKEIDEKLKGEVINLTGGHVRLTKLAIEAVLSHERKQNNLKSFLGSMSSIEKACLSIWQSLIPSEQEMLIGRGKDREIEVYFENIGLMKEGELQIPLFEEFVKSQQNDSAKLRYDLPTNTITRGQTIVSDALTKGEFKLLRLLLEHPDQIVEREQIVNTVWGEQASTAGVTEQALDQLIFRLRHKIERDPNNPEHLQTVKGRGVRFTP